MAHTSELVIGNKTYSSWSLRGWLMAKKTPLAFSERQLWLDTPEFAAQIRRLSPSGRVPVLYTDDLVIWDSLAIGEYLAERFPAAGLLPATAAARARMRSVCAEMHAGFATLRRTLPFNCRAGARRVQPDAATRADITRICALWRDCLAQRDAPVGGLFGGFTLADAMYLPVASRFTTYGVELDEVCSGYVAWCERDVDFCQWRDAAQRETHVIEMEEVGH